MDLTQIDQSIEALEKDAISLRHLIVERASNGQDAKIQYDALQAVLEVLKSLRAYRAAKWPGAK